MTDITSRRILTVAEAADELRLSVGSVYSLIKSGRITGVRVGERKWVISRQEVERVLKGA